jgi:hypothetical protein
VLGVQLLQSPLVVLDSRQVALQGLGLSRRALRQQLGHLVPLRVQQLLALLHGGGAGWA